MAATVEGVFRVIDRASAPLREMERRAVALDIALRRAGDAADDLNRSQRVRGFENMATSVGKVERAVTGGQSGGRGGLLGALGMFHSRIGLIIGAAVALSPAIVGLAGSLTQLVASLGAAVGGAGVVGGGLLGAAIVGFGSVMVVAKDLTSELQASQKAFSSYNAAVQMYGINSRQAATEAVRLNEALKQAPAGTYQFLQQVKSLGQEWDRTAAKAKASLLDTMLYGIQRLRGALPELGRIMNANVAAFSGAARGFFDRLASPVFLAAIERLSQVFRQNVGGFAQGLANLLTGLARLFADAAPFVREFVNWFERWTRHLSIVANDTPRVQRAMRGLVDELRSWLRFGGDLVRLMMDLFNASNRGAGALGGVNAQLEKWDRWLRENPIRIAKFFEDSNRLTSQLFRGLLMVVGAFGRLSVALRPVYDALSAMLAAVGPAFIDALTQAIALASRLLAVFASVTGPLTIILKALDGILRIINFLLDRIPGLTNVLAGVFAVVVITRWMTALSAGTGLVGRLATAWLAVAGAANAAAAAEVRAAGAAGVAGAAGAVTRGGAAAAGATIYGAGGGLLSRFGGALAGLGRAYLPIGAILAAGAAGTTDVVGHGFSAQLGQRSFAAANAATFGLYGKALGGVAGLFGRDLSAVDPRGWAGGEVNRVNQQIAAIGGDTPTLRQLREQVDLLSNRVRSYASVHTAAAGLVATQLRDELRLRQQNLVAMEAQARAAKNEADQTSRFHAGQALSSLGRAYTTFRRGGMTQAQAAAAADRIGIGMLQEPHLGGPGRIAIGEGLIKASRGVLSNAALANLEQRILAITGGRLVGNRIVTGSMAGSLAAQLASPDNRAAALTHKKPTALEARLAAALSILGWDPASIASFVQTIVVTGGATARQAIGMIQAQTRGHATGGRIGGIGMQDTVPVPGGMAAPGELIVNRHTENRVNMMLGGRTSLGAEVARESRPHYYATGGRVTVQSDSTLGGVNSTLVADVRALAAGTGTDLIVTSGYRGIAEQTQLYNRYRNSGFNTRYIAAKPGQSGHNYGLALDVVTANRTPIANAFGGDVLARYGLVAPVRGDPVHTELLADSPQLLGVQAAIARAGGGAVEIPNARAGSARAHEIPNATAGQATASLLSAPAPSSGGRLLGFSNTFIRTARRARTLAAAGGAGAPVMSVGTMPVAVPGGGGAGSAGQYIFAHARQYGLDPMAVAAYALTQGGLGTTGGIGDNGTSFGPFQMHVGGALPSRFNNDPSAAQSWAWSPEGYAYGLQGMQHYASGLSGVNAAVNIIRRYGRGANPDRDEEQVRAAYARLASGVKWHGYGSRGVYDRPTLIGVGDRQAEEVTVRPIGPARQSRGGTATTGGINVHIGNITYHGEGDISRVVEREIRHAFETLATEFDGIGAGA